MKRSNLIWLVILLAALLGFISCNYVKNVRLLIGGELNRKSFVQTNSFEYRKGLIVLGAYINEDTTQHNFIFDTGAFNSKIENNLAEHLGLSDVATKDNSTAQGNTRKISVTRLDSIRLGDTFFSNIGAGKLVYDEKSASPCIAEDGIIGANLIKLAHWKIEYEEQKIHFSDNPFVIDQGEIAYSLPFKKPLLSGTPEIKIKIDGRTISGVFFDVGYNGGLILPARFAESFHSDEEQIVIDQSTTGIYGTNVDTLITKKLEVSIGGYTSLIPVEFSSIGKALLGNDFLQHFTVLINYERKKISLIPKRVVEITPGLRFIPGVLNDSLWVVNRTVPDSPLQLGDTLLSINKLKPADLFDSYCDYVMNIGLLLKAEELKVTTMDERNLTIKVK